MRAITVRETLKTIHQAYPDDEFTIWDSHHNVIKRGTYATFCRDVKIGKGEIVSIANEGFIDLMLQFVARKSDETLYISKIDNNWWIGTEER